MPNLVLSQRKYSAVKASALAQAGAPPLLAKLWASRGVTEESRDLVPLDALSHVREAAEVIARHLLEGRITVVSDYDADGATGCSVLMRTLRAFGADCEYIVPSRFKHGYGLTVGVVNAAVAASSPSLLVTVDNGVASIEGVAHANQLGLEVVVTDHHLPGDSLPDARVIVNPNLRDCGFPSKALAGCGVAWYVARALVERMASIGFAPIDPDFTVEGLLPLVALGTVADVVPLDANNRELIRRGLERIRAGHGQPGIAALARVAGRNPLQMAVTDFGFAVGPRLNAAGRMETMDAGIECLLTDDSDRASELAKNLEALNKQRKDAESTVVTGALTGMESAIVEGKRSVVVFQPEWHEGVVGIAAGRLKEKAWRPTFVFTRGEDGNLKGSGRSIPGFHLRDALVRVDTLLPGVLIKFGGHAMAAGATLPEGRFEEFRECFEHVAAEALSEADLNRVVEHDGSLSPRFYTMAAADQLRFEVWGQMFPEPLFLDSFEVTSAKPMGKAANHLKLGLTRQGEAYEAVKFFADGEPPIPGAVIQALYRLDVSQFAGRPPSLQLRIEHLLLS